MCMAWRIRDVSTTTLKAMDMESLGSGNLVTMVIREPLPSPQHTTCIFVSILSRLQAYLGCSCGFNTLLSTSTTWKPTSYSEFAS